jgi:uncharacterized repeat protein (TIGR01451 family)
MASVGLRTQSGRSVITRLLLVVLVAFAVFGAFAHASSAASVRDRDATRAVAVLNSLQFSSADAGPLASSAAQITITPAVTAAVPSGQASNYSINFECSSVSGNTCGTGPTITIPIADVQPAGEDPDLWTYAASSSTSGLINTASYDPTTQSYVITLNPAAVTPGTSYTVQFSLTQPNNTTANGTSWSLTPSFQTSDIPVVTAPAPATGSANAQANLSVAKNTSDGGSVYVIGNNVIYNITARCNAGGATGNLYLTSGTLQDVLPSQLSYVSSSPEADVHPAVGSSGTVQWTFANSGSLPAGCSGDATGTTTFQLVATLNSTTTNNEQVPNNVTFGGIPVTQTNTISTTAQKVVTGITTSPPTGPGNFISKSAFGPLNVPNFGFAATYPGHWITPSNARPTNSVGSVEGSYTVNISYPASQAYTTALVDPLPCLDTVSGGGNVFGSNIQTGPITNDPANVSDLCAHPAFNPTVVQVNSANLAAAVTGGNWVPIGIETDGTPVNLVQSGSAGSTTYFSVPAAQVGNIAAILLPSNTGLEDVQMSMTVYGYAAASLAGGDVLDNTATATAYPTSGSTGPVTQSQSANLYIEPSTPQLGVFKSFGALGSASGGTTPLNIRGQITTTAPLPGNVILTDLLPYGLSWANPVTSANFTITSSTGVKTTVTATVQDVPNFQSGGQELIRITVPSAAITSGYYTISPPSGFINLTVPSGAQTYNNTIQEFVTGIAQNTQSLCGPGTGTTASQFESSDPNNLSGTGVSNINYCQWSAALTVPPTGGPSFSLLKTVQGNLDSSPKFPLGVGNASEAGTGVYTLTWRNTGGTNLENPVIYDILPYVGDTGVTANQSTIARDSQFATIFTGVVGSLPAGVSVEYSQSTNPCRPEVFANSANPSCVNDWSTTPPADLGDVKAVEFIGAANYAAGSSFSVQIGVQLPAGQVNTIAWNSAAADANDNNGNPLLPAEPPKVGITAPAAPLTPTVKTDVSDVHIQQGGSVHDTITVGNTGGASGTIDWTLVGPLAPNPDGSCTGLDWSGAATADSGSLAVAGDNNYTTADSTPTAEGCYSYQATLTGAAWSGPVSSDAGSDNEIVLLTDPALLTITKQANVKQVGLGKPVTFTITVTNSGTNDAYGVAVKDTPKTKMRFVSADTPQGSCGKDFPLTCDLGTVAAGKDVKIKVKAVPLTAGSVANSASVTSVNPDPAPPQETHATSTITTKATLKLTKTASAKSVKAGDRISFKIEVQNPYDTAVNRVLVCDAMPAGLAFTRSSQRTHAVNGQICWNVALGPHGHNSNTITAKALNGATRRVTNNATVSGPSVVTRKAHVTVTIIRKPPHTTPVTG